MPFNKITLEEDEAIKRLSSDQDPLKRFKWEESLGDKDMAITSVRLQSDNGEQMVELSDIANTVGNALANLLLSKGEEDVFNRENKDFVAKVACAVGERFQDNITGKSDSEKLSENEFHRGIERVLIENNAHDVARSLVFDTARNISQSGEKISVRLIRRNNQVVS